MGALEKLQQKNGLKTTQSVLNKQQSGQDAAQKANPQETAQQMNLNTAQAMLHGKEQQLTPPKDAHEQAVRTNQQTAEGMLHGEIPIVKKEEPKEQKPEQPKQLTYADMYKMLNPEVDSEALKERREKRERRNMRIAAIGDGLRALSNMVFATKGAKVVHNPDSDLSATMLKRKRMIDAQRDKNKAAWLNGYQRALALDEEARKNNLNIAEQMRYHDILADKYERAGDQADKKIEQSGQRLQQGADRLEETRRHNVETEQNTRTANEIRATNKGKGGKSGKKGGGKSSKEDYTKSLVDLNSKDPNGVKAVTRGLKRSGVPRSAKTIVESYRKKNGGSSSSGNSRTKQLAKKYGF